MHAAFTAYGRRFGHGRVSGTLVLCGGIGLLGLTAAKSRLRIRPPPQQSANPKQRNCVRLRNRNRRSAAGRRRRSAAVGDYCELGLQIEIINKSVEIRVKYKISIAERKSRMCRHQNLLISLKVRKPCHLRVDVSNIDRTVLIDVTHEGSYFASAGDRVEVSAPGWKWSKLI